MQLTPRTGAGFYSVDLEGIENDGCNGTGCDLGFNSTPFTIPLVANFTLIGCGQATCMGASGGHGMMLRRGTGGYYVNGVVARWTIGRRLAPRSGDVRSRRRRRRTPAATADLQLKNIFFAEVNGKLFQTPSATQFELDSTANNLKLSTATAASLFTAIPAVGTAPADISAFDFTPAAGSPIATGGLSDLHRRHRDQGRHVRDRHGVPGCRCARRWQQVVGWLDDLRSQLILKDSRTESSAEWPAAPCALNTTR